MAWAMMKEERDDAAMGEKKSTKGQRGRAWAEGVAPNEFLNKPIAFRGCQLQALFMAAGGCCWPQMGKPISDALFMAAGGCCWPQMGKPISDADEPARCHGSRISRSSRKNPDRSHRCPDAKISLTAIANQTPFIPENVTASDKHGLAVFLVGKTRLGRVYAYRSYSQTKFLAFPEMPFFHLTVDFVING